jgi:hypothetical protein
MQFNVMINFKPAARIVFFLFDDVVSRELLQVPPGTAQVWLLGKVLSSDHLQTCVFSLVLLFLFYYPYRIFYPPVAVSNSPLPFLLGRQPI